MKTYEVWSLEYEDGGGSLSLGTSEEIEDQRSKRLLDPNSRMIFRIQAETREEALAVRNTKFGWSPYVPNGKAAFSSERIGPDSRRPPAE